MGMQNALRALLQISQKGYIYTALKLRKNNKCFIIGFILQTN